MYDPKCSTSDQKHLIHFLQHPSDLTQCGVWRLIWPQMVMHMKQLAFGSFSTRFITDFLMYSKISCVQLQRAGCAENHNLFFKLAKFRERYGFKITYDIDDVLFGEDMPSHLPVTVPYRAFEPRSRIQDLMEMADEVTCSTESLKRYYQERIHQKNITVIPNYPPYFWIGKFYDEKKLLDNYRKHKKKPRIFFAGSDSHFNHNPLSKDPDDFSHVKEVILKTLDEFQWIFCCGYPREFIPLMQKKIIEYVPCSSMDIYPRLLSVLEGNMAIAPLHMNIFNECKSDVKFLESGALGIPCACQKIAAFDTAPIHFTTGEEMISVIKETLENEDIYLAAAREARRRVETRWLEHQENIGKHVEVLSYPFSHHARQFIGR